MSRKDYDKLARVFAVNRVDNDTWRILRDTLACVLADDNPRFNLQRFEDATERGT